ncbi:MAG: class I mannose-6-phosphate isomerase [Rikenellaceae bacterium]|nr:class I mannose-6-phosphate isomerase [Rikenellaceae bacterium]
MLYPLRFRPRLKPRIWGGSTLIAKKGKGLRIDRSRQYGESWDLSGLRGDLSVVTNGMLKGNNIEELVEVYMGDLVGEKNFERFGIEFPLLIKMLDAQDTLSIQVHPDDELAAERHDSFGKSEMWYITQCEEDASIYVGFKRPVSREEFIDAVITNRLPELLNHYEVKKGDVYYIPAGTIHTIGKGIELIEIQQTSDITYRVYDWDRVDSEGRPRELHTALAIDAINFESDDEYVLTKSPDANSLVELIKCNQFTTNLLAIYGEYTRVLAAHDTFVVYIVAEGELTITTEGGSEKLTVGELVLIPAETNEVTITGKGRLLETYVE